jgi:hypothetical protein
MNHPKLLTFGPLAALLLLSCSPLRAAEAGVWDGKSWKAQSALTVGGLPGFTPGAECRRSRSGGWADRQFRATGFFRSERAGDRWWLVDPEGYAFLSVGLCSVNLSNFDPAVVRRTFPTEAVWSTKTADLLKTAGFNTLGRWSQWETFRSQTPTPYTTKLSFMQPNGTP